MPDDYEARRRNYYGHQGENARARQGMQEAGVPQEQLPMDVATEEGAGNYLNSGAGALTAHIRDPQGRERQNAAARAQGFVDASQMEAYMARRNEPTGGVIQGERGRGVPSRTNPLSWTPQSLFDYVNRKFGEATGN